MSLDHLWVVGCETGSLHVSQACAGIALFSCARLCSCDARQYHQASGAVIEKRPGETERLITKETCRSAVVEATIIVAAAVTLGMTYAAATGTGLFQASPAATSAPAPADVGSPYLTLEQAEDLYRRQSGLFIDSRHPDDFVAGHIRGAINVPLHDFGDNHPILSILAPDQMLVTYCDGEDCNSSADLAASLRAYGFSNVRVFFGGWKAWREHKQPTEP